MNSQERIDTVVQWALSMVGTGYVYGATGWVCSKARREQQAAQYPEYANTILTTCAKWDGKVCHDCAQFTRKAMAQIGITLPSGATSQWKADVWEAKGTIDNVPRDKLCLLYRESGGKMQHTLIYLGDGRVVDARGSSQGVMLTELGAYKATHWAIPKGLYDNYNGSEGRTMSVVKVCKVVGGQLALRESASKEAKRILWIPDKAQVSVLEQQTPTGWAYVSYNGQYGYVMTAYIQDVESIPDGSTTTDSAMVTLTLSKMAAESLYAALKGVV